MICPNCGANNSARATFCKRCRQRLPLGGLNSGVSYPRRRYASTGNSKVPIVAALLLAVTGLVVGVLPVSLARPGGNQGPIAVVTPTPSLLPTFAQDTPTPTPPPLTSFAPLPTPFPPTPTPDFTPVPTAELTPAPTPTATTPSTPKPPKTPKPSSTPTPTPPPTDTPAPTATPFDCAAVAGTGKADSVTLTNNDNKATPPANKIWCLNSVSINHISGYGSIELFRNQKQIAHADCTDDGSPNGSCTALDGNWNPPLRVTSSQTLTYLYNCIDGQPCVPNDNQATITVDYEQFAAP